MPEMQSRWQSSELATAFLQGVRGAIPDAGRQLEVIAHILLTWCPNPKVIVDLGCGDGALGRSLFGLFPKAQFVFADFSEPMLEAVRTQLGQKQRTAVVKADFSNRAWLETLDGYGPVDAVVSGFAIHHQPDQRKRSLYGEIFALLAKGGVFLNLEHVASPTPAVENLFDHYFIDHLHRFHLAKDPAKSRQEIADAYYNRPDKAENILAPMDLQCQWLREIGFVDVDCFFKVFELALFGGRKLGSAIEP